MVLRGEWLGCEEDNEKVGCCDRGFGRRAVLLFAVLRVTHWTQSGCLKQMGVSLGLALNCVCGTGMSLTQSTHWRLVNRV